MQEENQSDNNGKKWDERDSPSAKFVTVNHHQHLQRCFNKKQPSHQIGEHKMFPRRHRKVKP